MVSFHHTSSTITFWYQSLDWKQKKSRQPRFKSSSLQMRLPWKKGCQRTQHVTVWRSKFWTIWGTSSIPSSSSSLLRVLREVCGVALCYWKRPLSLFPNARHLLFKETYIVSAVPSKFHCWLIDYVEWFQNEWLKSPSDADQELLFKPPLLATD